MATIKIDPVNDDYTGKHVVINCRTSEVFACDTEEERDTLVASHAEET